MPGLMGTLIGVIVLYAIAKLVIRISSLILDAAFVLALVIIALKFFGVV